MKIRLLVTAGLTVVAAALFGAWLASQHNHAKEIEVSEQFVNLLRSGQYAIAYELTMKERMYGLGGEPFDTYANRQLCGSFVRSEVFPYQSNGNRLRRQLAGTQQNMEDVNIQYEGTCFFRVTLRQDALGAWKVFKFGHHSG
jgi:hypothetical protein